MTAQHLFNAIFDASVGVTILALVTGLGLSLTLQQILAPLVGRGGDSQAAISISVVAGMRFTPVGLIVIATVLHNQGANLIPALVFSRVGTVAGAT